VEGIGTLQIIKREVVASELKGKQKEFPNIHKTPQFTSLMANGNNGSYVFYEEKHYLAIM